MCRRMVPVWLMVEVREGVGACSGAGAHGRPGCGWEVAARETDGGG